MDRKIAAACLLIALTATLSISAQNPEPCAGDKRSSTGCASDKPSYERNPAQTFLRDQKDIWTSPGRLKQRDFKWLVPFAGITTALIATDEDSSYAIGRGVHYKRAGNFSDAAVMAVASGAAGTYLLGRFTDNPHLRETGFLAGEAMTSAFASSYALKFVFERNRPFEQQPRQFFQGGSAFPSDHSAAAWSFATVIAHEYPNPLMQIAAYGSASAVSMARVYSRDHSLSDVFVGAALGYGIGTHIYHARHVDTDNFGTFLRKDDEESPLSPDRFGSEDVALGSWIYPAMERLIAQGYVDRAFLGLRPWSRVECARMLQEANEFAGDEGDAPVDIARLITELNREFATETRELSGEEHESLVLESVYTRVGGIVGDPVNDSYHLGQTIINDYGRPYQSGFNNVTGFSSRAHTGRFSFVVNGEYQHAPGAGALPLTARQAIATADEVPLQPAVPIAESNQFRLLETYVGMN
ncbi:MAG TPA: phosphatase PAP2 family protein, partial [candidate division Zixibacteria bacterium]|nr:phosphatase PAP2 family protein [candidate division Zixibacteria bacterium]